MNKDQKRVKAEHLPPGIHPISREEIGAEQAEEFIAPEATPSRDKNDLPCSRCGKPRENWDGPGLAKSGKFFCSEACAEGEPL